MNKLYVGLSNNVDLPRGGCLLIDDQVRAIPEWRHPRTFDPLKHSFNPLSNLDYRKACAVVDIFDALFSRGDSTLTKDTGLDFISELLEEKPASFQVFADLIEKPDKKSSTGHIWAYGKVRRILRSPVLSKVFCGSPNFSLKRGSVNQARVSPSELGDFDALALGLFIVAQFPGQVVIRDFGFYARDFHASLIRETRLIAGVHTLSQLKGELRDLCLLMDDKVGRKCTFEDAEVLARYAGHVPTTTGYQDFVETAMS